jgi:hypothetical protein
MVIDPEDFGGNIDDMDNAMEGQGTIRSSACLTQQGRSEQTGAA